jgi:hypothetical protein
VTKQAASRCGDTISLGESVRGFGSRLLLFPAREGRGCIRFGRYCVRARARGLLSLIKLSAYPEKTDNERCQRYRDRHG